MTAHDTAHAEHHVPDVKPYLIVFGALLVLTGLTVWVSHLELQRPLAIFVGLTIATIKASLVAAFFMHLIGERGLIFSLLGLTVLFCIGLYAIPIVDFHDNSDRITHTPVLEEPADKGAVGELKTMNPETPAEKTPQKPAKVMGRSGKAKKGAAKR
jgi:cytochrome c oxidase subunit 4